MQGKTELMKALDDGVLSALDDGALSETAARSIHDEELNVMREKATKEDREAAAWIFGHAEGLRHWVIARTTAPGTWPVEERIDGKNGGTYIFCPCAAWKFRGQKCVHTRVAVEQFPDGNA